MKEVILSLDQGTTSSRAILFDAQTFAPQAEHQKEFAQIYPQAGWVEHNPDEIWQSVAQCIAEVVRSKAFEHKRLVTIGITNQRETVVAWNLKTGQTAGNALVWQDRRTAAFCNELKSERSSSKLILEKTGLVVDPYFSASKMRWMLKHSSQIQEWAKKGELAFGTIDCYLIYRLSGGQSFVTEHSNASRTMLYNLHTGNYDKELLQLFGIPENALPKVLPSIGTLAHVRGIEGLPDGTPITGCLGDQQAALFGQRCVEAGQAKITFGTGAFLLMNIGAAPLIATNGLLTTVAFSTANKRTFALEGAAFIAGAAVQFLRDNFQWFQSASECEALALASPRDENVLFIPALTGLAAPYWNPQAKGVLFGLTRGTDRSQVVRAVLESIALQNAQILKLMETTGKMTLKHVGVDGGAAHNNSLMQFQADVLRTQLVRPRYLESTALGAALAAALGAGHNEVADFYPAQDKNFSPQMSAFEAEKIAALWQRAAQAVDSFYR